MEAWRLRQAAGTHNREDLLNVLDVDFRRSRARDRVSDTAKRWTSWALRYAIRLPRIRAASMRRVSMLLGPAGGVAARGVC